MKARREGHSGDQDHGRAHNWFGGRVRVSLSLGGQGRKMNGNGQGEDHHKTASGDEGP